MSDQEMADNKKPEQQSGPSSSTPRNTTTSDVSEVEVLDNLMAPPSLGCLAPILRVADEIQHERPRVAYLCRNYALEKAHKLDKNSNDSDVGQFKTSLLQLLERDNASSLASRVMKSDAQEIESYYSQYYKNCIRAPDNRSDTAKRAQLGKAFKTVGVLSEVSTAVKKTEKAEHQAKL